MATVEDEFGTPLPPPLGSDRLKLGMLTEIRASAPSAAAGRTTAVAMSVRFRSEIVGPVSAVDAVAGTLTVLGQLVKVGAKTAFDETLTGGLAALHAGDVVEVYGQYDARAQRYTATRIEPRTGALAYKLRGRVSAVNADKTLVIGGQTIDTSGVVGAPAAAVGQTLRVLLQTTQSGTAWVATAVDISLTALPDRTTAEIEGRISEFTSTRRFAVDGIAVETSDTTVFTDGTVGLVLGAKVEVKGSSRDGVLIATRVGLKDDNETEPFELSGALTGLDTAAKTFVIRGITVSYAGTQRFEGGREADLPRAKRAEVRGALSSDGTRLNASFVHMEL
jgi:hypothetical protein